MSRWLPWATRRYEAAKLDRDEPFVRDAADLPGTLLRIRPYREHRGIPAGVDLFRSMHHLTTNWRGNNTSDAHAFELRFDEGTISFHLYAPADSAEAVTRYVGYAYPQSEVEPADAGPTLPAIDPDDYVAGARVTMTKPPTYPIRQHDAEGFETDPYGTLTAEMLSTAETTVAVQFVVRPADPSWTSGDRFKHNGVKALAHAHRQGTSDGWLNPRTLPAGEVDERIARRIEEQRNRAAYHVTIRVGVWSPDALEAAARARGVARTFGKHYSGITGQRLDEDPVWHRRESKRVDRLRRHVTRMADREWVDRRTVMTVDELAGIAHLPTADIETPNVDWRTVQPGDPVTAETDRPADRHDPPARDGGRDAL